MTNVTDLRQGNAQAARNLVNRFAQPSEKFDRKRFKRELPMVLETALGMILDDIGVSPGQSTSSAIGCRIIAACICRLKD